MSFAAPIALLALLVIPAGLALHAAARRRRRRHALRFPAAATVAAVLPGSATWRRRVPPLLLALAVATLAFALARPQRSVAVAVKRASVMLVLDCSRSMIAQDVRPSRIEAARRAANRFLDEVPSGLQVGMVAFNTVPIAAESPTTDHDRVRAGIATLQADGGTDTGDALLEALKRLRAPRLAGGNAPPAAIVLLSDGKWTDGPDPVPIARRAGQQRIPIYTVALGTSGGAIPGGPFGIPLTVPPDPESLRQISQASGGQTFAVQESAELNRIYQRLGAQVGTRKARHEVTASFAGAGLVLLLLAVATSTKWRGRVG